MTKERLYEQSFADAALFLRCGNAGGVHRQIVKCAPDQVSRVECILTKKSEKQEIVPKYRKTEGALR